MSDESIKIFEKIIYSELNNMYTPCGIYKICFETVRNIYGNSRLGLDKFYCFISEITKKMGLIWGYNNKDFRIWIGEIGTFDVKELEKFYLLLKQFS